jgi:hypothetical protein
VLPPRYFCAVKNRAILTAKPVFSVAAGLAFNGTTLAKADSASHHAFHAHLTVDMVLGRYLRDGGHHPHA